MLYCLRNNSLSNIINLLMCCCLMAVSSQFPCVYIEFLFSANSWLWIRDILTSLMPTTLNLHLSNHGNRVLNQILYQYTSHIAVTIMTYDSNKHAKIDLVQPVIQWSLMHSLYKVPVIWKVFPFDDVILNKIWHPGNSCMSCRICIYTTSMCAKFK